MLKRFFILLVLVVGGVLGYAATRPDTYRVQRSGKIDAPAAVVFSQIEDFKAWGAWSPWEKMDPQMKKTFEGPPKGVGSTYSWQGNNKVGKGKMSITESQAPSHVGLRLEFIEPFSAIATTSFDVKAADDATGSTVTWTMDGSNNLIGKVFGLFMNMDKTIGADFEQGLAGLKTVSETEAKKLAVEAAAAKAKAEADAAVAAKAKAEADAAAAAAAEAAAAKSKPKGKRKH